MPGEDTLTIGEEDVRETDEMNTTVDDNRLTDEYNRQTTEEQISRTTEEEMGAVEDKINTTGDNRITEVNRMTTAEQNDEREENRRLTKANRMTTGEQRDQRETNKKEEGADDKEEEEEEEGRMIMMAKGEAKQVVFEDFHNTYSDTNSPPSATFSDSFHPSQNIHNNPTATPPNPFLSSSPNPQASQNTLNPTANPFHDSPTPQTFQNTSNPSGNPYQSPANPQVHHSHPTSTYPSYNPSAAIPTPSPDAHMNSPLSVALPSSAPTSGAPSTPSFAFPLSSNSTSSSSSTSSAPSSPSSSESTSTTSSSSVSSEDSSSSPSTLNMEDSDKKYVAMETNKPKTWLAAYNSLAPRTRQTVRTAVIAIVSALALVAIFHLAKLAEHPVSENVIQDPAKGGARGGVGGGLEVEEVKERDHWRRDQVYKSPDGKVFGQSGGGPASWLGAQFDAGVGDGVGGQQDSSPVLDVLARARPAIHPILHVPVDRDFLHRDIQRLKMRQRQDARPANATDIANALSLVRRKVEAERKQLSSKKLRLWSTGEAPLRVLLVGTWRSGSTFLAQALASHPAVFYHYEPFSPRGVRQVRSGRDAFQAQQLLHRLMDCQFEGQVEYLNYTRHHGVDMVGHNRGVWEPCQRSSNVNSCYNATFLSQSCQMFPVQLVKTVRLRLNLTQLFLNDERMNVKVVFLVRDPRATMSSRYSSVSWCSDHPDCSSPEVLCSDLQADLKVATALQHLYPERFTQVKYEDVAMDPQVQVRRLMSFLGLEFTAETARFVQEHTQADQNNPWSIKRKSSDRVNMWKKQLPLQEVHAIQNACESVLKTLQYEVMGQ